MFDENIFGKIRGRFDEVMAQREVMTRRQEMVFALVAMSDADLKAFIKNVNAMHREGDRRLVLQKTRRKS